MDDKQQTVLGHVARYRVTTRAALSGAFPGLTPQKSDYTIKRLLREMLIRPAGECLLTGHTLYQLTRTSAGVLGLPLTRAANFQPQALLHHTMVLYFCTLGRCRRQRLESREVELVLQQASSSSKKITLPANMPICLEWPEGGEKHPKLTRMYVPGPQPEPKHVLRHLFRTIRQAASVPALRETIESREMAFAVLVDNDHRREALRSSLAETFRQESFVVPPVVYIENVRSGVSNQSDEAPAA